MAESDGAKGDGRWDRAYAAPAAAKVLEDLAAVLDASASFAELDRTNRYALIHRTVTAPNPSMRAIRIARLVAVLEAGGSPHPQ